MKKFSKHNDQLKVTETTEVSFQLATLLERKKELENRIILAKEYHATVIAPMQNQLESTIELIAQAKKLSIPLPKKTEVKESTIVKTKKKKK